MRMNRYSEEAILSAPDVTISEIQTRLCVIRPESMRQEDLRSSEQFVKF